MRSVYDSAVRGILFARNRLVSAARNAFNNISNALVATRDRMIRAASVTANAIRSGAERARIIAVTTADNVLQTAQAAIVDNGRTSLQTLATQVQGSVSEIVNNKIEKAKNLWVTTRNDATRFGRGGVMYGVRTAETIGTFAQGAVDSIARSGNEFVERIQSASSLRDIGVAAWVFGRDMAASIVQQGASAAMQHVGNSLIHSVTIIVDAMVPDAVMRELMRTNLGWYADQNAAPTATVNAHFGGTPLYYINGVTTGLKG